MVQLSNMRAAVLAAAAAIAAAAIAQPPAKPATKPAAAPAGQPQTVSVPGVSAQGNAALNKIVHEGDPIGQDAVMKVRALAPQIAATLNAQPLDVDKLGAQMRQMDSLRATVQSRTTERLIISMKALPPADRLPFVKAVIVGRQQAAQPPK